LTNIVIPHCDGETDVMTRLGSIHTLLPEEDIIAYVQAIHRDVVTLKDKDKEALWWKCCLGTVVEFRRIEEKDRLNAAINTRDEVASRFLAVGRTSFQRMFEVMRYWQLQEGTPTARTRLTISFYTEKLRLADTGLCDKVTASFIEACVSVHERAFSNAVVLDTVAKADAALNFKSPFDSVHKMKAILGKTKGMAVDMEWVFTSLSDSVSEGHYAIPGISWFRNELPGCVGKSIVDLILLQRDFKDYVLNGADGELVLTKTTKDLFEKIMSRADIFRSICGSSVPQPWRVDISPSDSELLKLLEDVVFTASRHHVLKKTLQKDLGPAAALKALPVSEQWAKILELRVAEKEADEQRAFASGMGPAVTVEGMVGRPSDDEPEEAPFEFVSADKKDLGEDLVAVIRDAERHAKAAVNTWVSFIVDEDPKTVESVTKALSSNPVMKIRGDVRTNAIKYFGIVYEQSVCGETLTQPQNRVPSLRDGGDHLAKRVNMILHMRDPNNNAEDPSIEEADVYMFFMGRSPSDLTKLVLKPFASVNCKELRLSAMYDENSLRSRKARPHMRSTVKPLEPIVLVTEDVMNVGEGSRKCFPGTVHGEIIGPIVVPDAQWTLTFQEKKELFGASRYGGDRPAAGVTQQKRELSSQEPVFYHSTSPKLYETIIEDYKVKKAILHLTPGDGEFAMTAYRKRVPYVGLCFTPMHKDKLFERLVRAVLNEMKTQGSQDYDASFAAALDGRRVKKRRKSPTQKKEEDDDGEGEGEDEGEGKDDTDPEGEACENDTDADPDDGTDGDDEPKSKPKPKAKAKGKSNVKATLDPLQGPNLKKPRSAAHIDETD
jgi:hypothetical protein